MKKFISTLAILCFSLNLYAANKAFDTIVVFGDSLSDNGNLYRYMLGYMPASPPYFKGRFSNGPLWIEDLIQSPAFTGMTNQPVLEDYAVGGAGAIIDSNQQIPFSLTIEVDDYLYWNTYGKHESSLYVIWIGANNYLSSPKNGDEISNQVVDSIEAAIKKLIANKGNKFFIANLPDMGDSPYAKENGKEMPLHQLTLLHNQKLAAKVAILQEAYPDISFVYFDAYSYFEYIKSHAADFGLTDLSHACYGGGYTGLIGGLMLNDDQLYEKVKTDHPDLSEQQLQYMLSSPALKEAVRAGYEYNEFNRRSIHYPSNCPGYFFWDHMHPSAYGHQLIADKVQELLTTSGLKPQGQIKKEEK